MAPILCTQPRRFAVVAVAKMVAKARKCEVGEEVGYHIGHSKHFSARYVMINKLIIHVLCNRESFKLLLVKHGSNLYNSFFLLSLAPYLRRIKILFYFLLIGLHICMVAMV